MPTGGLGPPSDSPRKTVKTGRGGAESGAHDALRAIPDPDLAALIDAWPTLPDPVRAGIAAMIEAAKE